MSPTHHIACVTLSHEGRGSYHWLKGRSWHDPSFLISRIPGQPWLADPPTSQVKHILQVKSLLNLSCNQDIVYQFAAVLAYPLATSSEYVFTLSFA